MLTDTQIESLVDFADDEFGCCVATSNVVATRDTAQSFIDACVSWQDREDCTMPDGTPVVRLAGSQRFKGEARRDLIVADFGEARGVIAV